VSKEQTVEELRERRDELQAELRTRTDAWLKEEQGDLLLQIDAVTKRIVEGLK
jgi:hypothetical protein